MANKIKKLIEQHHSYSSRFESLHQLTEPILGRHKTLPKDFPPQPSISLNFRKPPHPPPRPKTQQLSTYLPTRIK